jgi:hypothetical protein
MDESRENTDSQDSPRLGLGEATTFPLIIYYVLGHGTSTQMSFCLETPATLETHNFVCKLPIKARSKASCSLRWEISNGMWYFTCMQTSQGDSWLLVVGSQIDNLIPDLSLGHNLCCNYPNGSCETILDMYFLRVFQ